jgi:ABC-type Na+ efflux pump permease subunit
MQNKKFKINSLEDLINENEEIKDDKVGEVDEEELKDEIDNLEKGDFKVMYSLKKNSPEEFEKFKSKFNEIANYVSANMANVKASPYMYLIMKRYIAMSKAISESLGQEYEKSIRTIFEDDNLTYSKELKNADSIYQDMLKSRKDIETDDE